MHETNVALGRFAVEVRTRGESGFYGNAMTFPSLETAVCYAKDLYSRWTAVDVWRIVRFVPAGGGMARAEVKRMGE